MFAGLKRAVTARNKEGLRASNLPSNPKIRIITTLHQLKGQGSALNMLSIAVYPSIVDEFLPKVKTGFSTPQLNSSPSTLQASSSAATKPPPP
jgi:hypothetical protein